MANERRQYELVLLGATGYTGKLTAEHITTSLPTDLNWAIVGRNSEKLQNVIHDLEKLNPDRRKPAIELCELKKEELHALAKKTRLIITTVGPFMHFGEPVVEACATNGTHYLDCTGEIPWVREMIGKYDSLAKANGAVMIPQCGLDSVPADLLSYALASYIRKHFSAPTASVTLSLHNFKAAFSGGTAATALEIFSRYSVKELGESMRPFSLSPVRPTHPTPPPKATFFHKLLGLRYVPELGTLTQGLMAAVDACIVHRSWGLYESISRQQPNASVSYGPHFRFKEFMRVRTWPDAFMSYVMFISTALLAFPLTRFLLTPIIKNFVIHEQGNGPDMEAEKNSHFMHYRALGVADTENEEKAIANLEWGKGPYVLTGVTLAEAAMVMLRGEIGNTEAGRLGGGILTPALLGDQYLERLQKARVKLTIESIS